MIEFAWPNFIHKPDLDPTLRKAGQASENKKLNAHLAEKTLEILKQNSVMGLQNLTNKLADQTNNPISKDKMRTILRLLKGKIEVQDRGPGKETIYSARLLN